MARGPRLDCSLQPAFPLARCRRQAKSLEFRSLQNWPIRLQNVEHGPFRIAENLVWVLRLRCCYHVAVHSTPRQLSAYLEQDTTRRSKTFSAMRPADPGAQFA